MSKYRVVVHHVATDNYWYSAFRTPNEEQLSSMKDLLEQCCESGNYINLENEQGDSYFFPKNMIQECVFTLEKSHDDD